MGDDIKVLLLVGAVYLVGKATEDGYEDLFKLIVKPIAPGQVDIIMLPLFHPFSNESHPFLEKKHIIAEMNADERLVQAYIEKTSSITVVQNSEVSMLKH